MTLVARRAFGSIVAQHHESLGSGYIFAGDVCIHRIADRQHAARLRQFWWAQRAPAQEAILEALGWLQEQMAASGTARARP